MSVVRDIYQMRDDLRRNSAEWDDQEPISRGHKGAIINHLNKAFGDDLRRKLALNFLFRWDETGAFDPMSTRDLSEGNWHALRLWVDAWHEPESDEWLPNDRFVQEARILGDASEVYYYSENVVELDPMFDDYPASVRAAMKLGGQIVDENEEESPNRFQRYRKGRHEK